MNYDLLIQLFEYIMSWPIQMKTTSWRPMLSPILNTHTMILRHRNQYFLAWRSYPMGSWRQSKPLLSASEMQSVTPLTWWARQTLHNQSSSGTCSIGGSTHARWQTAEHVSQHSKSPSLHTQASPIILMCVHLGVYCIIL